jgi:hypothetical protein
MRRAGSPGDAGSLEDAPARGALEVASLLLVVADMTAKPFA